MANHKQTVIAADQRRVGVYFISVAFVLGGLLSKSSIDNIRDPLYGERCGQQLNTLNEILSVIPYLSMILGDEHDGFALFRGQNTPHHPLPGIARNSPCGIRAREQETIIQLKLRGERFPELINRASSDVGLLVVAQHYGLKTRLLDWTSCLPVALWFAFTRPKENEEDEFRYLYALLSSEVTPWSEITLHEVDAIDRCLRFQPQDTGGRVSAQHSWFTIHPLVEEHYGWGSNLLEKDLMTYKIPIELRGEILTNLSLLGYNERTIMPDLGGLCSYLNRKHLTIT